VWSLVPRRPRCDVPPDRDARARRRHPRRRTDRVVVAFDAAAGDGAIVRALDAVDAAGPHALPALAQTVAVTVEDGDAAAVAATLDRAPGVAWAEVDRRARAAMALPFEGLVLD
jgi:hypothetical protein